MIIEARVHPTSKTNGFADTYLHLDGGAAVARLDVGYNDTGAPGGAESAHAADFLLLASVIYGIDKIVSRDLATDNWTRDFEVQIPVSAPESWTAASEPLHDALCFLTGDVWRLHFDRLKSPLARVSNRRRLPDPHADAIALFSGGLDSLIGAIDWLELHDGRLLLVGHHDGDVPGPMSDQQRLLKPIRELYRRRTAGVFARVGITEAGAELTYRSRSLLFLALAMQPAARVAPGMPIYIPENGNIALNVPLNPARRGSCSTRTAHPYFLKQLNAALSIVGLQHPIVNPLASLTKGECASNCRNGKLLELTYPMSASCAKRGHRKSWTRRHARQCGRCMPCIFRRAALHVVDWDDEEYGTDICAGEVPVSYDRALGGGPPEGANDLRAVLAFIRAQPSTIEIGRRLLSNGSLDVDELPKAAALVERAMEEVRQLLRDKAVPSVRRQAGI
jgi:hypothetical protein